MSATPTPTPTPPPESDLSKLVKGERLLGRQQGLAKVATEVLRRRDLVRSQEEYTVLQGLAEWLIDQLNEVSK